MSHFFSVCGEFFSGFARTLYLVVADKKSGISCMSAIIHTNGSIKLYRDVLFFNDLLTFFAHTTHTHWYGKILFARMCVSHLSMAPQCNNPFVLRVRMKDLKSVVYAFAYTYLHVHIPTRCLCLDSCECQHG